jgi:hypothetical protein
MNKKLIVIVFLLWSLAYCAFGQANQWGPFDPGALRNDGSNASSAATVRDNLGLGTMAVATSTDYVATSALALRLDTGNASFTSRVDAAVGFNVGNFGVYDHGTATVSAIIRGALKIKPSEAVADNSGSGFIDTVFNATQGYMIPLIGTVLASSDGASFVVPKFGNNNVSAASFGDAIRFYSTASTGNTDRVMTPAEFAGFEVMRVTNGRVAIATTTPDTATKLHVVGQVRVDGLPEYADNAAAIAGGLSAGRFYRTATGILMVVYTP